MKHPCKLLLCLFCAGILAIAGCDDRSVSNNNQDNNGNAASSASTDSAKNQSDFAEDRAESGNGVWTTEDSWYNALPRNSMDEAAQIDRSLMHEVPASIFPEAEKMLKDVSVVELTDTEAAHFAGASFIPQQGTKPYLIRAIYLNLGTGGYELFVGKDGVLVKQGCLGRHALPMKRSTLVVQLKSKPKNVYHALHMAE